MAHRNLASLVFMGFTPTTSATVISLLGDNGLPDEIRILSDMNQEPWRVSRSGLLVIGMTPDTDLGRVSQMIQNRTTWWEVVVCLVDVLASYEVALLAQGASRVIRHPEEDLEGCRNQLRVLLTTLNDAHSDAFGLDISDLVQLFGEKRVDKTIRLMGGGTIGSIFLRAGIVTHAETLDDMEGMDAFRRLLHLPPPVEIRVHKGCLSDKRTMNMPAMTALLEGSRVHDEEMQQQEAMPHEDEDFILPGDEDDVAPAAPKSPAASTDSFKRGPNDSIFEELDFEDPSNTGSAPPPPPPAATPAAWRERT